MIFAENLLKYKDREYKALLQGDFVKFCEKLKKVYKQEGYLDVLYIIKISRLYVDPFCSQKYREKQQTIEELLNEILTDEEYNFLKNELDKIKTLNMLSYKYTNLVEQRMLNKRPDIVGHSISALLVTVSSILDRYTDYILSDLKKLTQINSNKNSEQQNSKLSITDEMGSVDNIEFNFVGISKVTSEILKFLMFYKKVNVTKKTYNNIPSKARLINSKNSMENTMYQHIIDFFITYWIYSDIDYCEKEGNFYFYVSDDDELNDYYNLKNQRTHLFTNISQMEILKKENIDRTNHHLDTMVENNEKNLANIYHIDNFRRKVKTIELEKWLKAFSIIQKECEIFIHRNRNKKNKQTMRHYCLIKHRNQWKRIFTDNEFTDEQAEKILSFFTFDKKSEDLMDCPFIEVEDTGELLVIPNIVLHTYASNAITSNFTRKIPNEVSFRGYGFEDTVNDLLNGNGIESKKIEQNVQEESYECDSCFLIDNTLYFVECKSHAESNSFEDVIKNLSKLIQETYKLNRIVEHFNSNLDYVMAKLNLGKNTEVKEIQKVILSATDLGNSLYINDVYITDYSTFSNFFLRNIPVIKNSNGGTLFRYDKKEYEGDITSEKFDNALNNVLLEEEILKHKEEEKINLNISNKISFLLSQIKFPTVMLSEGSDPLNDMKHFLKK